VEKRVREREKKKEAAVAVHARRMRQEAESEPALSFAQGSACDLISEQVSPVKLLIRETLRRALASVACHAREARIAASAAAAAAAEMAAADALETSRFSRETLRLARARDPSVWEVEASLDRFVVKTGLRKLSLRPMARAQRKMVHELAQLYRVATVAHGVEPHRHIDLIRTPATELPPLRLSEVVQYEEDAGAVAGGVPGLTAGEPDAAALAGGCGPASAAPAEDHWCLHLIQVQCSEGVVRSAVRASGSSRTGLVGIEWLPERRADRAAAREAMRLEARLLFDGEGAARLAASAVGGGRRGAFLVRGVFPLRKTAAVQPAAIQPPDVVPSVSTTDSLQACPRTAPQDRASDAGAAGEWEAASREGAGRRRRGRRVTAEEMPDPWPPAGDEASGAAAPSSDPLVPQLMEMGFGDKACRRALAEARKASCREDPLLFALDWLAANSNDEGA
jgi:hypothetical protein